MNSRRTPGDAVLPDGMWLEFAFDQAYLKVLRAGQRQTGQVTPEVTEQVTEQVARLVLALGEQTLSLRELMQALGLSHRPNFLALHLRPALDAQFLQMTLARQAAKPPSKIQTDGFRTAQRAN